MELINTVISWLMKQRIHQIELFMKYPHEVQLEWFRKLVQSARSTEWGTRYGYSSLQTPEEFRERVPLNDYDSLRPWIERLRKGEKNILWPSEIKWFAKSSGTTSDRSKFIPVSPEALEECHMKGGKDLLSVYCTNHPESKLFSGKSIAMGGSRQMMEVGTESYYYQGDLSAIILSNLPFWAEIRRTPDLSVALMEEWESKIEEMARITMQHDVTSIAGVPSWVLLLFNRILEKSGKRNLLEVWPNFELFMHGGVSFTPYAEQFRQILPSGQVTFLETYNASEGFFGIQDRDGADDMLLMLDYGIYYEFIPVDELSKEHPRVLDLSQVTTGPHYALVISTNAGLWRYIIGDTVRFTSVNPYRIRITGRTRNFINAFGEELIVDNADNAIAVACDKCRAVITDYTAAPVYISGKERGAHEWLVEFSVPPDDLGRFTAILDNALKAANSDYEAKRYRDLLLQEPIVRVMPSGTFYNWLKSKGKLGGQNKVPRLSNDRKYVEEILEMIA